MRPGRLDTSQEIEMTVGCAMYQSLESLFRYVRSLVDSDQLENLFAAENELDRLVQRHGLDALAEQLVICNRAFRQTDGCRPGTIIPRNLSNISQYRRPMERVGCRSHAGRAADGTRWLGTGKQDGRNNPAQSFVDRLDVQEMDF